MPHCVSAVRDQETGVAAAAREAFYPARSCASIASLKDGTTWCHSGEGGGSAVFYAAKQETRTCAQVTRLMT